MIHTEIDIPTHVYEDIKRFAEANRRPTDQVLREAIDLGVSNLWRNKAKPHRGLSQLAELGIKGPKDLALNLDNYLYGNKE